MATGDPIDISSSDNDSDMQIEVRSNKRALPSWSKSRTQSSRDTGNRKFISNGNPRDNILSCSTMNGHIPMATRTLPARGNRMLPPTMLPEKSTSTSLPDITVSSLHHSTAEDMLATDERMIYQAALEEIKQPQLECSIPHGLLTVPLLRHQKIALAWMLQKETRSVHCLGGILADDQGLGKTVSMIALIQMQKYIQSETKAGNSCSHQTEALNLDDDEDNRGFSRDQNILELKDAEVSLEDSNSTHLSGRQRVLAGTLIVCPASILRQWARELEDKVAEGAKLSFLVYHGGNRAQNPADLADHDVVLTTYSIVTNEVPKQSIVNEDVLDEKASEIGIPPTDSSFNRKKKTYTTSRKRKKGVKRVDKSLIDDGYGALGKVTWSRVILDEAQTIKNYRTQVARACSSIRAKRRWCLSGTPIQNTIDDLYSYFRFLRYEPYCRYKSFYSTLKAHILRNSLQGYLKLQAVLRAVMLRRTKGTLIGGEPVIRLPPKVIHMKRIDFSSEERAFYSQLEAESRSKFKAYAAAGTLSENYASILLMILRLRQACDHPLLVKAHTTDLAGVFSADWAQHLPHDMILHLLNVLVSYEEICVLCDVLPEDPVITICGHVFCHRCIATHMKKDDKTCPTFNCEQPLDFDIVFPEAVLRSCLLKSNTCEANCTDITARENYVVMNPEYVSSKIKAVLEIIQSNLQGDSLILEPSISSECDGIKSTDSRLPVEAPIKCIIFSQWTGMLKLVETALEQFCIQYRKFDGTMSLASRDKAVNDFDTDPEVTVMLMSLKAGNLGLNMVAASCIILLDLWWNPTTEDQAVDRAHRIGQTRPVIVSRLTVKDTIEDRILALQEEKRKMVASALGEEGGTGSVPRLTVEDLGYLFNL